MAKPLVEQILEWIKNHDEKKYNQASLLFDTSKRIPFTPIIRRKSS